MSWQGLSIGSCDAPPSEFLASFHCASFRRRVLPPVFERYHGQVGSLVATNEVFRKQYLRRTQQEPIEQKLLLKRGCNFFIGPYRSRGSSTQGGVALIRRPNS